MYHANLSRDVESLSKFRGFTSAEFQVSFNLFTNIVKIRLHLNYTYFKITKICMDLKSLSLYRHYIHWWWVRFTFIKKIFVLYIIQMSVVVRVFTFVSCVFPERRQDLCHGLFFFRIIGKKQFA